jgi:hypothetical protein
MVVRILIGVGLFALGYFMGKEMGRAESIRDQLRWSMDEEEAAGEMHDAQASRRGEKPGAGDSDRDMTAQDRVK